MIGLRSVTKVQQLVTVMSVGMIAVGSTGMGSATAAASATSLLLTPAEYPYGFKDVHYASANSIKTKIRPGIDGGFTNPAECKNIFSPLEFASRSDVAANYTPHLPYLGEVIIAPGVSNLAAVRKAGLGRCRHVSINIPLRSGRSIIQADTVPLPKPAGTAASDVALFHSNLQTHTTSLPLVNIPFESEYGYANVAGRTIAVGEFAPVGQLNRSVFVRFFNDAVNKVVRGGSGAANTVKSHR